MAKVNVLAKFLSQALEWKARFKDAQFYGGLRYGSFIYPWARKLFPQYDRLYPDNEEFTKRFVRDLKSKDPQLQKLINPDTITPEQVTLTEQFDRQAAVEQAQVAATAPAAEAAPTTTTTPGALRLPLFPRIPTLNIPPAITKGGKNLFSQAGIFFKKNVGKYLTVGNIGTVVSGGAGFMAGLGLTGGNPLGGLMGGIGGVAGRFWIGGGGGGQFLGRLGNGVVNFGVGLSNQVSTGSLIKLPSGRVGLLLLGSLLLLIFATGFIGAIPSGQPSPQPSPSTYTPGAGSGLISCPLNNGVITVGSKDAGGHCSTGYQTDYPCVEPDVTGRATAIDLQGVDRMVFLPNIGGNVVNWLVEKIDTDTSYSQQGILVSGGYSVIARVESGGKTYRIRFVHIESPNVQQGQLASSGTPVGPYRSKENHVHITIQEGSVFKPGDLYFNLCK